MSKKWLAFAVGIAAFVLVALAATSGADAWRAAYPHLPRRVQAAPYMLRSRLRAAATPIPLPTVAVLGTLPTPVAHGDEANLGAAAPQGTAPFGRPEATEQTGFHPTGTAAPGAAPPPAATLVVDLPPSVVLAAPPQQYQTWNNCGPATLAMALAVLGANVTQGQAATTLKPDPDDKNVSPQELAAYARTLGFDAQVRVGGTVDELRALIALGLPVIAETWFIPTPGDEMGHYILLHGYQVRSDSEGAGAPTAGAFTVADSYEGPGRTMLFDEFDEVWRVFDRTYVAMYPRAQAAAVAKVWGESATNDSMLERAETVARDEVAARGDAFAWFNLGSSLAAQGDPEAAAAFDRARALTLPWRMMWYQHGAFEAYGAVGRWDDVRALAQANLANAPNLEESHFWMGRAAEAAGDAAGARSAYQTARRLNPNYAAAVEAIARLAADAP